MRINGKTLYISDLDGTLLRKNEMTSAYTNSAINALIEKGMCFSYATARSYVTASKVTSGLSGKFPVIVYNGAFILDNETKKVMLSNFFEDNEIQEIQEFIAAYDINPIVYSFIKEQEKFTYNNDRVNQGTRKFLDCRRGDIRNNPVNSNAELYAGRMFYFTCIDTAERLHPLYLRLKRKYHCVYQIDIYSREQWLEILPIKATKANAILQLKEHLKCERVISFGDGKNDISMFNISDECYAVANAVDELKEIATGIIASNNDDGVAKWLVENVSA
ncbi:MAG: HAD family hydrolase [Clostridiales bacterium]|jgi:Cof subfamily protein (haloacid dehalogenase superfamily)|nr:HAD family hydrolase [Clostridiales bacterium]